MIVAVVEDLMFSVKISTTAKALNVDMYFERASARVLATVREKLPSLVIFDLNSRKLDPMTAIAAIKGDAQLREIRTLGYVSHVDSDTIAAARRAGIDQVLARSAFVEQLPEILTTAGATTRAHPEAPPSE